ncbi:MAG: hypothetical protein KHY77_02745 [Butyricicoccus pullicaecorum]|nr:hypothetical protein [Butyricicoccus pullicaecorum]
MKKFLEEHDVPRKVLAILMAIALWIVVVVNNESVLRENIISNIPVIYKNEDLLEDESELRIIEGHEQTVNVRVSGPYAALSSLRADDIQVTVDVSKFKNPGTYTINTSDGSSDYSLRILGNQSQSINPPEIASPVSFQVVVDTIVTKEIPVSIQMEGKAPSGYLYEEPVTSKEKVTITGPGSVVSRVKKAVAVIPEENSGALKKTTTVLASFKFLGENNEEIDKTHIVCSPNELSVTIPVYVLAKLPLTVELVSSETLTKDSVSVQIEPAELLVYGGESLITNLTKLGLGEIELGTVEPNTPKVIPIPLPAGITRVPGQPAAAKVTIKPVGMTTREFPISNITLENTGTNPDLTATLLTNSITVRIQADTASLSKLTADSLKVKAVVNAEERGPGIVEIPVEIETDDLENFTILNPEEIVVKVEIKQTQNTVEEQKAE